MTKELEAREKIEVETTAEQTREAPLFVPAVDICESADGILVVADMPGVSAEGLSVDLKDDVLTIKGEIKPEDNNRTLLYREYHTGSFYRQFTLSDVIDQSRISARLKDGVLTLELPKAEKAKPRQIEIISE